MFDICTILIIHIYIVYICMYAHGCLFCAAGALTVLHLTAAITIYLPALPYHITYSIYSLTYICGPTCWSLLVYSILHCVSCWLISVFQLTDSTFMCILLILHLSVVADAAIHATVFCRLHTRCY